eukprot:gene22853-24809_t
MPAMPAYMSSIPVRNLRTYRKSRAYERKNDAFSVILDCKSICPLCKSASLGKDGGCQYYNVGNGDVYSTHRNNQRIKMALWGSTEGDVAKYVHENSMHIASAEVGTAAALSKLI